MIEEFLWPEWVALGAYAYHLQKGVIFELLGRCFGAESVPHLRYHATKKPYPLAECRKATRADLYRPSARLYMNGRRVSHEVKNGGVVAFPSAGVGVRLLGDPSVLAAEALAGAFDGEIVDFTGDNAA